jgi:hypothetical protein
VLDASGCAATVASKGTCTLRVALDPDGVGDTRADVFYESNAENLPSGIRLTGTGTKADPPPPVATTPPPASNPTLSGAPPVKAKTALPKALAKCAKLKRGKRAACVKAAKRQEQLRRALVSCQKLKGKKRTACTRAAKKRYRAVAPKRPRS